MPRHDIVRLNKEGLFGEYYDSKLEEMITEGIHAGGKKRGEFFWRNMNTPFAIEGTVTLRDLIDVMMDMNAEDLRALSTIADANLAPYLVEYSKNPGSIPDDDDDGSRLKYIEVYKCMEFSNWESCDDLFSMEYYTSAHGIGEIWKEAKEDLKAGKIKEADAQHCDCYAIEFTPWQKMLDLPIRMKDHFYITETVWKKNKNKKKKNWLKDTSGKPSSIFRTLDRELVNRSNRADKGRKVRTEMTLQEFFKGLFNELCFFGSPERRDAESGVLKERIDDVEKFLKNKDKK